MGILKMLLALQGLIGSAFSSVTSVMNNKTTAGVISVGIFLLVLIVVNIGCSKMSNELFVSCVIEQLEAVGDQIE